MKLKINLKNLTKKQRIIAIAVSCCLVVAITLGVLWYTLWRAPRVEDIYDRVVELVEASYEINTVFLGAGLPVYPADSPYAELNHLYFDTQYDDYEIVTNYTKFVAEQDIRDAAEQVYSKAYLEDVLYNNAFVGYAIDDGTGTPTYAAARYLDENGRLYQSKNGTNYLKNGMRVYDFSTMKVVAPSNSKVCYISIESYLPSAPNRVLRDNLRLVLQEDGQWYLDSFTG